MRIEFLMFLSAHDRGVLLGLLEVLLRLLEEGSLYHCWCIFVGIFGSSTVTGLNCEFLFRLCVGFLDNRRRKNTGQKPFSTKFTYAMMR